MPGPRTGSGGGFGGGGRDGGRDGEREGGGGFGGPRGRGGPMRRKKKKRVMKPVKCRLTKDQTEFLDYKDVPTLEKFITQQGKILSRKRSGCNAQQQRAVAVAIKHARHLGLLPFVAN